MTGRSMQDGAPASSSTPGRNLPAAESRFPQPPAVCVTSGRLGQYLRRCPRKRRAFVALSGEEDRVMSRPEPALTRCPPPSIVASPKARIAALARDDKWFLGGLEGVVWAPPFPRWLHRPGFWDPAHLLQHEVGPGFSVALVRPDGRENPLHGVRRGPGGREPAALRWRPGRLDAGWLDQRGVLIEERRQVLPGGILESSWRLPRGLEGYLVGFTAQPADATDGVGPTADGVGWTRTVSDRRGQELVLDMELAGLGFARVEEHRGVRRTRRTRMAAFALCGKPSRRELRPSPRRGVRPGRAPLRMDLDRRRRPAGGDRR